MGHFNVTSGGQTYTGNLDNTSEDGGRTTHLGRSLGELNRRGSELSVSLPVGGTITLTHDEIARLARNTDNTDGPSGRVAMLADMLRERGPLRDLPAAERAGLATVILGSIDNLDSPAARRALEPSRRGELLLDISRGGDDAGRLSVDGRPVTAASVEAPRAGRTHREPEAATRRDRELVVGDPTARDPSGAATAVAYHYDHAGLSESIRGYLTGGTGPESSIGVTYGGRDELLLLPPDILSAIASAPSFERRLEIASELVAAGLTTGVAEGDRAGFVRDNAVRLLDALAHLPAGGSGEGGQIVLDNTSNQPSRLAPDGAAGFGRAEPYATTTDAERTPSAARARSDRPEPRATREPTTRRAEPGATGRTDAGRGNASTTAARERALAAMERDGVRIDVTYGGPTGTTGRDVYTTFTPAQFRRLTAESLAAQLECTPAEARRLLEGLRADLAQMGARLRSEPGLHVSGLGAELVSGELDVHHALRV